MSELKKVATRAGFGEEILKLGKENPDILVIDADIGKSCKTGDFRKELSSEYHDDKNQYVNVGIAEQNAAGVAAGLATCGKVSNLCSIRFPPYVRDDPSGNLLSESERKDCMLSWWTDSG